MTADQTTAVHRMLMVMMIMIEWLMFVDVLYSWVSIVRCSIFTAHDVSSSGSRPATNSWPGNFYHFCVHWMRTKSCWGCDSVSPKHAFKPGKCNVMVTNIIGEKQTHTTQNITHFSNYLLTRCWQLGVWLIGTVDSVVEMWLMTWWMSLWQGALWTPCNKHERSTMSLLPSWLSSLMPQIRRFLSQSIWQKNAIWRLYSFPFLYLFCMESQFSQLFWFVTCFVICLVWY